jgi:hypothetical protein
MPVNSLRNGAAIASFAVPHSSYITALLPHKNTLLTETTKRPVWQDKDFAGLQTYVDFCAAVFAADRSISTASCGFEDDFGRRKTALDKIMMAGWRSQQPLLSLPERPIKRREPASRIP